MVIRKKEEEEYMEDNITTTVREASLSLGEGGR
jgi:hypothetical protein